jgi:aryl-alcohol dehydrogenase-like predicted oxidoreductase
VHPFGLSQYGLRVNYRLIPGTELSISSLAMGGWLTLGDGISDAESSRILHAAIDGGITFLDLADVYANGGAERVVGSFLQETDRDRLIVSSKVFWPMGEGPNDRGLGQRHIHASIDGTLTRLGIDHLDLYFCHREDPSVPLSETVQAMGDLVQQGKIRAWGTSCWRPSTLREAHRLAQSLGVAPPRVEQPQYSLLVRGIENDLVPVCQQLGMGLVAFSPMAGGVLSGKYLDGVPAGSRAAESSWLERFQKPAIVASVREFVAWCQNSGQDPAAVALAWVMSQSGITSAICGARSEAQIRQNLLAADLALDDATKARLDQWFPHGRRALWKRVLGAVLRLGRRA